MADGKGIISATLVRLRQTSSWWWSGIGRRISFFMTAALVFIAELAGAFFSREGRRAPGAEIRNRVFSVAKELAALTAEECIPGNRSALSRKIYPPLHPKKRHIPATPCSAL